MAGRFLVGLSASTLAWIAAPTAAQTSSAAEIWATQGADCLPAQLGDRAWEDPRNPAVCRARAVLSQFRTVEEKLRFLAPPPAGLPAAEAEEPGEVRDVAKALGLPQISGSDGPAGLTRSGAGATALPSPMALAASFDRDMAEAYGNVIGREFRAAGLGNLLGPAFDIARTWKFGRLSESFGEDPYLMAEMAAHEVGAITSHKVNVTMKHFAVYAQEAGRVGDQPSGSAPTGDNIVSEKALREIYLPGFEAAVTRGGAGGVMCAFPKINGTYACENAHLFDILKREWGFDGFVGPDFPSAQRSIARAVVAGLDSGFMAPVPFNAALANEPTLAEAVEAGVVSERRLDDMILRRLIPYFRIGTFDDPPPAPAESVSTPENRALAADILAAGTVLLKNDGGILPFGPGVKSIALIGPQATERAVVVEQGSPYVEPAHLEPPLEAIRRRAGSDIAVTYAPGTLGLGALPPIEPALLSAPGGGKGFRAEYYANPNFDFSGKPLAVRTVADASLAAAPEIDGLPEANQWSVRYTSIFAPRESGMHRFTLHGSGTARLFVDGEEQGFFELADFSDAVFANVPLSAGDAVELRIEYTPRSALRPERTAMFGIEMGLTLRVGHAPPDDLIAQAAEAARQADVAVVFAGELVGEGMDRQTLALQGDQDRLIEAVAAANPNTVVVLNTGGPVAMPWLGQVAGVMEMWLPGDAYGSALADILFGDREPTGKLPVTFPADETQGPATARHQFPGVYDPATGRLAEAYYDEGVFVGYRYWDQYEQQPLFPFGFGLGYGDIAVEGLGAHLAADGTLSVRARLTNRGERAGSEVAQLYLGFPEGADEPPKQLKQFRKVALVPGASREIELAVPRSAFRHWDAAAARWRVQSGEYRLMLGTSSRDIVWEQSIQVTGD